MKLLFYTGTFTHPIYKEQFKFFPEDVEVVPSTSELLAESQVRKDYSAGRFRAFLASKIKRVGLKVYEFLNIPKYVRVKNLNSDFVYAAQYLVKNDVDYVSDFEHATVYSWYNQRLFNSKTFQNKLNRIFCHKRLKFLLPWTDAARQSLLKNMDCSGFADKIKVVYPAIEEKKFKKIKHDGINVLFVGGAFYWKGGIETLLAFERVKKQLPDKKLNMTVVSGYMPEISKKYDFVNFKTKLTSKELDEEYRKSDIFILPTHMDTFGYVLLEAMSYGLPCISIDNFAVPEIIADGKTGFVVKNSNSLYDENYKYRFDLYNKREFNEFTNLCMNPKEQDIINLAKALKKLVKSSVLLEKMSINCLDEIRNGRFSKKNRIQALKNLFGEMK